MNITDTMLSAFLDAELAEAEMEQVRNALAEDEHLADHLAELAMVDQLVRDTYTPIEQLPIPELALSPAAPTGATAQVIALPLWRRATRALQRPMAAAAAVALAIGLVINIERGENGATDGSWQQVAASLETGRSGIRQQLADGSEVLPQLSFVNRDGEYCRQFYRAGGGSAAQGIACRDTDGWQLRNSVPVQPLTTADSYQTATAHNALEQLLDDMIASGPLDADGEAAAIASQWQPVP
ncbi:MAG: hypothetical protein GYB33_19160 [Gammaproteobacteria bacterium]|nr:hypothetical protein [Gammaproteobacteria bacterium]